MRTARRTWGFTESVIRGMTRLANEHGAINLSQGFPDFPCPDVLKEAAARAIHDDVNQYAVTWGTKHLREALAAKYADWYGMTVDPVTQVTVTCGATEAMAAVLLATVDPGEEVIVLEPFYENYGPDAILCGARPVFVPVAADGPLDLERIGRAFSPRTRAIILNTPNNPTGRVLTRIELSEIAALCITHDALALVDEIYEHIIYDGEHVPLASLPGMRERTVTISGASKTFSVTGWRIGTIIAPAGITEAIRKVHDFLTVGAPAPLQEGVAAGRLGHVGLLESVAMIADTLGWTLDAIDERIEPVLEGAEVRGLHQVAVGRRGGQPAVTLDLTMAVGAEDPRDVVTIDGEPPFTATIANGIHGDVATCALAVNAVPQVLAARQGLISVSHLPPIHWQTR